jgi:Rieske Fe-S protein
MKLNESVFDRRQFLNGLAGAGAVVLTGVVGEPMLGFLTGVEIPEPDHFIVEGKALDVLARQRFVLVPYGPAPVMIFRLPDGALRALSAVCTHGQCNVHYRPEDNDIRCPCHGGRFTADGINVPGTPPPRPLRQFEVRQMSDGSLRIAAAPAASPDHVPPPEGALAAGGKG